MPLSTDQQAEIDQARAGAQPTLRPIAPALEEILYQSLPVLDHGFVRVVDYMGDDAAVVQAARVSYGRGTKKVSEDRGLINYLMRHRHTTPFEMCEIKYHVKLPIFVARQFVRHRTIRLNEVSGRYVQLPAEWYIPEVVGGKAKSAKQGQEDNLSVIVQDGFKRKLNSQCEASYDLYLEAMEQGVAPEHARMFLHLNHYTHWLWNQDLHNLMHFLSLRDHSHAQVEAQAYAKAIDLLIRQHLPRTMELYDKYRRLP